MKAFGRRLNQELTAEFVKAVHSREPVTGHTHPFYRYPARFSPLFARAAIKMFTQPGDLISDPFMGGGTTLVEARVQGRHSVGVDISSLSNFIAQVKTTVLSEDDIRAILSWSKHLQTYLHCHKPSERPEKWIRGGYQRNITGMIGDNYFFFQRHRYIWCKSSPSIERSFPQVACTNTLCRSLLRKAE